jgi:hypothetical protein
VKISNILVEHPGGGTKEDAAIQIEEKEKAYPEPTMFGTTPAHGLMVRHAEGIVVSDFKVVTRAADARPCFVLDDIEHVDFSNIQPDRTPNTPVFVLNDVKDFSVVKCKSLADTEVAEAKHKEL